MLQVWLDPRKGRGAGGGAGKVHLGGWNIHDLHGAFAWSAQVWTLVLGMHVLDVKLMFWELDLCFGCLICILGCDLLFCALSIFFYCSLFWVSIVFCFVHVCMCVLDSVLFLVYIYHFVLCACFCLVLDCALFWM